MNFLKNLPFSLPQLGRSLLQFILVMVYIIYFGYPAVLRYSEKKTYILSDVKETNGIPAPSVTICPLDKSSAFGWRTLRNDSLVDVKFDDDLKVVSGLNHLFSGFVPSENHCGEDIDKCVAQNTFEMSDAIVKVVIGSQTIFPITNGIYWKETLAGVQQGRCFTFDHPSTIGFSPDNIQVLFYLNSSFDFYISLHDPHYIAGPILNPLSVPGIGFKFLSSSSTGYAYHSCFGVV